MALYIRVSSEQEQWPDRVLTPFALAVHVTLSGSTTAGAATVDLQELPGRFGAEWDDLSVYLGKGIHLAIWEEAGGLVAFRLFGGLIADVAVTLNDPDSRGGRRYRVTASDYSGPALDDCAVGVRWIGRATPAAPGLVLPPGTLAGQIRAALRGFNGGARLHIDPSGVGTLIPTYQFPRLDVYNSTLRAVLRTLLARAVAYRPALKPRFQIDVARTGGAEFGGPVCYVTDAAVAGPTEVSYRTVPRAGWASLVGPLTVTTRGAPPFTTRALLSNTGGFYAEATAPGGLRNPLNRAGTWDRVITNAANLDASLPGEAARLATQDATARKEYTWSSYTPARPGAWVALAAPQWARPVRVVVTACSAEWTEKAQPTAIDGRVRAQPVLYALTGQDRVPELWDDAPNGPDLAQVLALTTANAGRNTLYATGPGYNALDVLSDADPANPLAAQYRRSWYHAGIHHPIGARMQFAADGTKYVVAEDAYADMAVDPTETSGLGTEVITFTKNGSPAPAPFSGAKGDRIGVVVTGSSPTTPLALLVREADQAVTPASGGY